MRSTMLLLVPDGADARLRRNQHVGAGHAGGGRARGAAHLMARRDARRPHRGRDLGQTCHPSVGESTDWCRPPYRALLVAARGRRGLAAVLPSRVPPRGEGAHRPAQKHDRPRVG